MLFLHPDVGSTGLVPRPCILQSALGWFGSGTETKAVLNKINKVVAIFLLGMKTSLALRCYSCLLLVVPAVGRRSSEAEGRAQSRTVRSQGQ